MADSLIQTEQHLPQMQRPRVNLRLYVVAQVVIKGLKRLNAALAKALLKGEPSWMMFK